MTLGVAPLWGVVLHWLRGQFLNKGARTPFPPVPGSSFSGPFVETLLQDQSRLKTELTEVKGALAEEMALNAKRHEDLLAILSTLSAKLSPPAP